MQQPGSFTGLLQGSASSAQPWESARQFAGPPMSGASGGGPATGHNLLWNQPGSSGPADSSWDPNLAVEGGGNPQEGSRSRNPCVFTVMDRQVFVHDADNPPPLYIMARKWVQNDRDNDLETVPGQPNLLQLPPVKPKELIDGEPPEYEDNFEDYDPEEALRRLKEHWVNVRQWHISTRKQHCGRFTERMKAMMPGAMLQVTPSKPA